ncbi:MAG: phosphoribosyltransferase family protein [Planctomycetota bacterium]
MGFIGWRGLVDWVFPKSCSLCSRLLVDTEDDCLCNVCRGSLRTMVQSCQRCGAPLPQSPIDPMVAECSSVLGEAWTADRNAEAVAPPAKRAGLATKKKAVASCSFCKNRKFAFEQTWSYCIYSETAMKATRLIKEPRHEALARCIADTIGEWLLEHPTFHANRFDYVVPIPQYWLRRWMHRYNQAEVLAENIARWIECPLQPFALHRCRWTQKQGLKTVAERRINMIDAFGVRNPKAVREKRILLVDDVMTSGATLHDAAKALRSAGAQSVAAVVFARGVNAKLPTERQAQTERRAQSGSPDPQFPPPSKAISSNRKIH